MKNSLSKIYKSGEVEADSTPFMFDLASAGWDGVGILGKETKLAGIERTAYEKGFTAGERAGIEMGKEKVNLEVKRLSSLIEELFYFKERFYADREKEVVELIMTVARKIVHAELSINRDIVTNVVKAAIGAMSLSEKIRIKMNPDDIEYLVQTKPDFLKTLETARGFAVERDSHVDRGGCVIESNHGEVDARIEEGLKAVEKTIDEALKK